MLVDRKPILYLWRPVYRTVFQRMLWPFLARVKAFFFVETRAELDQLLNTAARIENTEHRVELLLTSLRQQNEALERRLAALEAEQANQWNNMSKLLLCLYQQPKGIGIPEPSTVSPERTSRVARTAAS